MLVVFGAVVYLIVRNISLFGNVLLVLLGFGAVVIVHEFGHFIVAKLSDIKVEAFSIFMPPTLLGIQRTESGLRFRILPKLFPKKDSDSDDSQLSLTVGRPGRAGETEYRIGLVPFGGFVKMLGQEDTGPVKENDDPRSFANKAVGIRMAVISAGVFFNLISAIILFVVVFLVGIRLTPPIVGGVAPNSPAALAGIMPGDEIIEVGGKRGNLDFGDIRVAAALSGGNEEVSLKVRRGAEVLDFAVAAERKQTTMGEQKVFGILPADTRTVAQLPESDANTLFERTGLKPGDRIRAVNGKEVYNGWELKDILDDTFAERTDPVSNKIESFDVEIPLSLLAVNPYEAGYESSLGDVYLMHPRLKVTDIVDDSAADKAATPLQSGDIVVEIADTENPTYEEMRKITTEYENKELTIKVLRKDTDGIERTLTLAVMPRRSEDGERVLIGVGIVRDLEHAVVAGTVTAGESTPMAAIPSGALITTVNGVGVSDFYDIAREIGKNLGRSITIAYVLGDAVADSVVLTEQEAEKLVPVKSVFAEIIPFEPLERLYRASGPVDAVVMGYKKTLKFIAQTYVTLKRLIGGVVKVKDLTGPVGIMAISYRIVTERPFIYYLYFVGLISAIIAVMNFLPLAPLDGGWIVFLLVEKFKGSALSERVQGAIVYTGWALIGALLLYVTFNDFVRYIVN
jgi:regulator of sigma E protease